MLWLAGLVAMAGVGTAVYLGLKADVAQDDEYLLESETFTTREEDLLLRQIKDHSTDGGRLTGETSVAFTAAPVAPLGDNWGDDVLDEVMTGAETGNAGATAEDAAAQPAVTSDKTAMRDADDPAPEDAAPVHQLLSEWIEARDGAEGLDYEARTESLMVIWDDTETGATEPRLDVAPDREDPEIMHVSMNGERVAEVHGNSALSVADLMLIPLSSAMAVGLEAV